MFHWQNIVSRNQTTSRSIHSALYVHDKFKTGWLWWEFEHLFCVPDTADIKLKIQKRWKHTKQIFPEQKTKKSFVLHHLCPEHELLTGTWNPLISGQIVNSFGLGKCTFDRQSSNLRNYASGNHVSTSSCMLRIEILITFNVTCMWTFHTNSLLHEYLFLMHVHK